MRRLKLDNGFTTVVASNPNPHAVAAAKNWATPSAIKMSTSWFVRFT